MVITFLALATVADIAISLCVSWCETEIAVHVSLIACIIVYSISECLEGLQGKSE